jgi:predicted TPR repeat methyltransferase
MIGGMSDLDKAYALNGPEDCARLYADWAASYDAGFAADMDYRLPAHVAAAFLAHGGGPGGPVLDVGAGTGLLAAALREQGLTAEIDGIDLSPDMLARAQEKRLYTRLVAADVTQPLALPRAYAGIVSSGTFTHGHVGPDALGHLEAVAAPGALFALSINAGVYRDKGFDIALSRRPSVTLIEVSIYGPRARAGTDGHADDRALIALWRHPG